jgi:hypothetical protein
MLSRRSWEVWNMTASNALATPAMREPVAPAQIVPGGAVTPAKPGKGNAAPPRDIAAGCF